MAPIPASATTTVTDTQEPSTTSFPLSDCLAYTRYIPTIIIVMSALYGCVYCLKGIQMQLHRREKSKWSGPEGRTLNDIPMGFRKPGLNLPHAPPPSLVAPNERDDRPIHEHHHEHRPSTSTTVRVDESPRQKIPLASWWKWLYEKRMRQRQWSISSGFREYPHGRHMQDLVNQRLQQLDEDEEHHRHNGDIQSNTS